MLDSESTASHHLGVRQLTCHKDKLKKKSDDDQYDEIPNSNEDDNKDGPLEDAEREDFLIYKGNASDNGNVWPDDDKAGYGQPGVEPTQPNPLLDGYQSENESELEFLDAKLIID